MDPIPSPMACCLDPSHGPIRDGCNCASGAHSEHTLNSHHNFRPQDPIPAQPSSVRLLGLGEVFYTGPTLPYSSHGFGPLGIPSMAGITSSNGIFYAGRVPSIPSIAERDEQNLNGDMHPVDFGTSFQREAVGTYHSLPSAVPGQFMSGFPAASDITHATIPVQSYGQQACGVPHQEPVLPAHESSNMSSMNMPIFHAAQARVTCLWPGCNEDFLPILDSVVAHLRTHSAAYDGRCFWPGCGSTPKNVGQHVLDSHCDLRWICPRCFRSDFEAMRSMKRHLRGSCKGRSSNAAAICAHCGSRWKNQADMVRHAPYCIRAWSPDPNI